jgi:predicted dinucleotide-binding enzyme
MATGLGKGLARADYTVVFGSRQPGRPVEDFPDAKTTSHVDAIQSSDIVILGLPYPAIEPFARDHAEILRERLVIDISNPFDRLPDNRRAGAEITADAIGDGSRVVAAFKANFSTTLLEPVHTNGTVRDVLFACDREEDREVATGLIKELGFYPVYCGALHNARILDGMVPLLIELEKIQGKGDFKSFWKFVH